MLASLGLGEESRVARGLGRTLAVSAEDPMVARGIGADVEDGVARNERVRGDYVWPFTERFAGRQRLRPERLRASGSLVLELGIYHGVRST